MVCSSLQAHGAHFVGVGGANRVLALFLVFCPLERHLRGAGWGGLSRGHLDNVAIKVRVLKIEFDRSCQSWIHFQHSEPFVLGPETMMSLLSVLKLGAFGHIGNVHFGHSCSLQCSQKCILYH